MAKETVKFWQWRNFCRIFSVCR